MVERQQPCFDALDAHIEADDDLQSFHSYTSTFSSSTESSCSACSSGFESVSEVLSAAVLSSLNLPTECTQNAIDQVDALTESVIRDVNLDFSHLSPNSRNLFDMEWLQMRCDCNRNLVNDVLRAFSEQGHIHVKALQISIVEERKDLLAFHAVNLPCKIEAHDSCYLNSWYSNGMLILIPIFDRTS